MVPPHNHSLTKGIPLNAQPAGLFKDLKVVSSCMRIFQKMNELICLDFYKALQDLKD